VGRGCHRPSHCNATWMQHTGARHASRWAPRRRGNIRCRTLWPCPCAWSAAAEGSTGAAALTLGVGAPPPRAQSAHVRSGARAQLLCGPDPGCLGRLKGLMRFVAVARIPPSTKKPACPGPLQRSNSNSKKKPACPGPLQRSNSNSSCCSGAAAREPTWSKHMGLVMTLE